MSEQTIILIGTVQREAAHKRIDGLPLDGSMEMAIRPRKKARSTEQNSLLHAVLTDISNQIEWSGKKLSVDIWKRLCMASWLREKKEQPILIPALDGHGFDVIFERTSKLSSTLCAELIEWCFAFGAEHNVKFRDRCRGMEDY